MKFGGYDFDSGFIFFPLTYIISDIITEIYGLKICRKVIMIGMISNIIFALFIWIVIKLPHSNIIASEDYFALAMNSSLRIFIASIISYLVGELLNATLLAKLKFLMKSTLLWLRTIISIIIAALFETIIFMYIAFIGVLNEEEIWKIMFFQIPFKVIFIIIFIPVIYFFTNKLKIHKKI